MIGTVLCLVMLGFGAAAVAFAARRPKAERGAVVASEAVMLGAMVDVCLLHGVGLPAIYWSLAVALAAMAVAVRDRRRGVAEPVHPLGLLIGAGLIAFAGGAGGSGSSEPAAGLGFTFGHSHAALAGGLPVLVVLGVAAYAIAVLRHARRGPGRNRRITWPGSAGCWPWPRCSASARWPEQRAAPPC